jgi:hypothetical protein
MEAAAKNLRKYTRHTLFPHIIDVKVKTPSGNITAGVHNISQGGLGLFLDSIPIENSNLTILFKFPNETIELKGTLKWKAKPIDEPAYRAGFEIASEDQSKAIRIIDEFIDM